MALFKVELEPILIEAENYSLAEQLIQNKIEQDDIDVKVQDIELIKE